MLLCGESAFDFQDPCVRSSWGAILPILVVTGLCAYRLPIRLPSKLQAFVAATKAPFITYLTLREAEALDLQFTQSADASIDVPAIAPLRRSLVFAFTGLLESLAWLVIAAYDFMSTDTTNIWGPTRCALVAMTWLYTAVRPIVSPPATAPYDLFTVYALHVVGGVLVLGGHVFDSAIGVGALPSTFAMLGLGANLVLSVTLLCLTVQIPMDLPSTMVNKEEIGRSISPEDYTRLWEWISFKWVYPLVKRGTNTTLNEQDVWGLSPTMQSRPIFIKFQQIRRITFLRRVIAANSLDLSLDFLGTVLAIFFQYAGPFFLKQLLDLIDQPNPSPKDKATAYMYAGLMFLCSVLKAQCELQHLWFGRRVTTRVRSELMAAIYDKALRRKDLSSIVKKAEMQISDPKTKVNMDEGNTEDSKAGADTGKIVNLMSGDAEDISFIASSIFWLYGAPFEIVIGGTFFVPVTGIPFLVLASPLNSYVTSKSLKIQKGKKTASDKRLAVVDELIAAIKFIKFFAWEDRWIDRAMSAREEEIAWMVKGRLYSVFFTGIWYIAPILLSLVSFFTYIWFGNELTVGKAFTAIALFAMIRAPLNTIPTYIMHLIQASVSLKRIAVFLDEEEVSEQVSSLKQDWSNPTSRAVTDEGLGLENATLQWNQIKETKETIAHSTSPSTSSSLADVSTVADSVLNHHFELKNISVLFPENKLSLITGPTASGKTALLMALMGEMTLLPGGRIIMSKTPTVDEDGNMHGIAYAAQSPWLRHQSIRDNILFGSPMDEARYDEVIRCCALKPDFDMLEDGDMTEIGVRGVSLSGGQKARVALARAVYSRKKYVLLDDPLSAVDSHTSRFLYENCLQGSLLANRTVILVTHHVELVLPGAHYLVRMLDGRIDTQGTVQELRAQGVLEEIKHEAAVEVKEEELAVAAETAAAAEIPAEQTEAKKPRKLVDDEHRETGSVKLHVYKTYLAASSYYIWAILVALVFLQQLRSVSEKLWIKVWAEAYNTRLGASHDVLFKGLGGGGNEMLLTSPSNSPSIHLFSATWRTERLPSASDDPMFYIGVYAAINLLGVFMQVSGVWLQYTGTLRASRLLFKRLLVNVVRATFRFHDTTPQGRMLNRFSKDFATIDSRLAGSLQAVNNSLSGFFVSILTVTIVFPPFLFPAAIIVYLYRSLAVGYLNTGRDLRRMESNTRSPIFSEFGELLTGIVTVRAFSAEKRFMDSIHTRIDETTKMWYAFWMTNRWLLINFDLLGSTSVFTTALFAIAFLRDDAGLAGLAITSALNFSDSVYWACRFWTGLELDLNSVERITEYMELPQEPPAIIESSRPPAYWPSSSNNSSLVVVEDLQLKYAPELPAVLQDVSFELKAGERIGLVGRTGSGKSTLAMSLLRFVDPSSGRILIDGIDISKIGIYDLRSRITFIPQDATLFSGSLRDNLDPFGDHEDSVCMDALRRVHLITETPSRCHSRAQSEAASPLGTRPSSIHGMEIADDSLSTSFTNVDAKTTLSLETRVSAGGTNFSQGQRQLIAMARALLRRSAIVVMDEATSSVDFTTDSKIQKTIREEFVGALLITVAHRLSTIIDYDRVLVLDKGKVVEFDTPMNLIQREGSVFRGMCLKSGSFSDLEAAAVAKSKA